DYRIAINVASQLSPAEVEYFIDPQFSHPFLAQLEELPLGWQPLQPKPGGPALDYIRTNLFDPRKLVPLPFNVMGPDNDLNEKLDTYIQRAMADEDAVLYAFGERWGPENNKKDKIFAFSPGNGVHDIHMNQSNVGAFVKDDGVYQDGGLLIYFPHQQQWIGIFLKFQSQGWHTDDSTGHKIANDVSGPPSDETVEINPFLPGARATPEAPDGAIRIVAALANGMNSPETETITILNVTNQTIDLNGWKLLDANKNAQNLTGVINSGETVRITVVSPVVLPNKGGLITLLNPDGLRVDGVGYTKKQASLPGYTIKF
ncbi:MAG TPA: DUF2278 family protein, partial [Cellvibrionaceae bacterium]|nr:DUF2278 family protein [Cellvibrionaceae bacterium]